MPEARAQRLVRAGAEAVFDFIAEIENAPRWMFGVRRVEGAPHRPLQEGDEVGISLVAGGKLAESRWVIGRCERPSLLTSSGQAMGASAELQITCTPAAGGTLVTQSLGYRLPGGPLGLVASRFGIDGILELQAHRSLQTLASLLEPVEDGTLVREPE